MQSRHHQQHRCGVCTRARTIDARCSPSGPTLRAVWIENRFLRSTPQGLLVTESLSPRKAPQARTLLCLGVHSGGHPLSIEPKLIFDCLLEHTTMASKRSAPAHEMAVFTGASPIEQLCECFCAC